MYEFNAFVRRWAAYNLTVKTEQHGEYSDWLTARKVSASIATGPTQPFMKWAPGAFFTGVKRPGLEAGHFIYCGDLRMIEAES